MRLRCNEFRTLPEHSIAERRKASLALRTEGMRAYGRRFPHDIAGPKARVVFPRIGTSSAAYGSVRVGPLRIADRPPIVDVVERVVGSFARPITIVEIGPGEGRLAGALRERFGAKIVRHYGIDRDPLVAGPFARVHDLDAVSEPIDLVIASEVVEHMSADDMASLLASCAMKSAPDAAIVLGTPNPLVAGGILRDVTHIQHYPWFDLYAIVRLFYGSCTIERTHYVCTPQRLLQLAPRIALARLQELDWCEGLIAVGSVPRVTGV